MNWTNVVRIPVMNLFIQQIRHTGGNVRITVNYALKIVRRWMGESYFSDPSQYMLGDWGKKLEISTSSSPFPKRDSIAGSHLHEAEGDYPRIHWLFPSQFRCWNLVHVSLLRVFAFDTNRRIFTLGCKFLTARRYAHQRNLWRWPHEVQTWSCLHKICVYLIVQSAVLWCSWTRQPSWFVREDAGLFILSCCRIQRHSRVDTLQFLLCWYVDCPTEWKCSGV
jgi:hypothetical protein